MGSEGSLGESVNYDTIRETQRINKSIHRLDEFWCKTLTLLLCGGASAPGRLGLFGASCSEAGGRAHSPLRLMPL